MNYAAFLEIAEKVSDMDDPVAFGAEIWAASAKVTAQRCREICYEADTSLDAALAIKKEFDLPCKIVHE